MRVLFYTLYDQAQITFTAQYCDYMVDCLFHGFRSLLGQDCIDYFSMPQWYNTIDKTELYGNGFTIYGLLPQIDVDKEDLDAKIEAGYFDQIIVGLHNNRYHCDDNINVIKKLIGPKNNIVKIICGNDYDYIDSQIAAIAPYFKREYTTHHRNVYPINFCIPKEKIVSDIPTKNLPLSTEVPNFQGKAGWKIKDEQEFYHEYQRSIFALTQKKGGWDCLRHYEILMNGCIPLFLDIDQCPEYTLHFLPKDFLSYIYPRHTKISDTSLFDIISYLLEHTRKYLTTEAMAKYILGIN